MSDTSRVETQARQEDDTSSTPKLRGNLGVFHLIFTVMAFNAPLTIVIGVVPLTVAFGKGIGAPAVFVVVGVVIGLFAVGFTTMARYLPNPGAFYSYITAGLGKAVGLGSSFIALLAYFLAFASTFPFSGILVDSLVHGRFHGPEMPWWFWELFLFAAVAVLGYFRIDLSAKVLSVFLVLELAIVLVYDFAVAGQGGASGLSGASFTPHAAFSGSFGIIFMFAVGMFGGFEATAIFRDEVRNPTKTVPRATYAVVAVVTVVYAITAWLFIEAYGGDKAVGAAAADPTGSIESSIATYAGHVALDVTTVLVNTSVFAAMLAGHNIASRYLYNLSADGILPQFLSRVHAKHGSPHRASIATSAIVLVGLVPCALAGIAPADIYPVLFGVFSYAFVVLLVATCIAVPAYMRRKHPEACTAWNSVIAPGLAFLGLSVGLVLSTLNLPLLIGSSQTQANVVLFLVFGVFALGVIMALIYRVKRPQVYARIGRQE